MAFESLTSFWLGEDEMNRISVDSLFKLASHRRAIANMVRIVTGQNIPVKFNQADKSFMNEKTVVLSGTVVNKNYDSTVGLALHEGTHVVLSSLDAMRNVGINISPAQYQRARALNYDSNMWQTYMRMLLNVVEDRRIDAYQYKNSPGYQGYYHALYERYFYTDKIAEALKSDYKREETLDSYEFRFINIVHKDSDLDALKGLREIAKILNLDNMLRLKSSMEAFAVAQEIGDIILKYVQAKKDEPKMPAPKMPPPPADPSKSDDEDDSDDDQNEEGKGNSNEDDDTDEEENEDPKGNGKSDDEDEDEDDVTNTDPSTGTSDEDNKDEDEKDGKGKSDKDSEDKSDKDKGEDKDGDKDSDDKDEDKDGEPDDSKDSDKDSDDDDQDGDDKKDLGKSERPAVEPLTMTKQELEQLKKDEQNQKSFLNGNVDKSEVSKDDAQQLEILEKADIDIHDVPFEKSSYKTVVIKKVNMGILKSVIFPFKCMDYNGETVMVSYKQVVLDGIKLGRVLGNKLMIRNEPTVDFQTRKPAGKVERRLLHELSNGEYNVFSRTKITESDKSILHISIDASGSMAPSRDSRTGLVVDKFGKSLKMAVAICKAASMTNNIDVVVSLRGDIQVSKPLVAIVYDSRVDTFKQVETLFPYLYATTNTPEGLCFEGLMKEVIESAEGRKAYFLNLSDGMPAFTGFRGQPAVDFTRKAVEKIRNAGIEIMSYYISADNETKFNTPNAMSFKTMYGEDARIIDTDSVVAIAKSMNEKFLQSA